MSEPDFFTVARSRVKRLAIELQETDGLSTTQVADVLLATALSLSHGVSGPIVTASVLHRLADRVEAGAYEERPASTQSPLN